MNKKENNQMCNLSHTYPDNSILILVVLFLSCVGCNGTAAQKEISQVNQTSQSEINKTTKNDNILILNQKKDNKKDGLWKEYHENGRLKSEGNFTEGLKQGLHREWEKNGILLLEGFYIKGKANGLMKWFHEKGHLAGEGNMIENVRVGPWKICDIQENGFCIEANFKNGKRDGKWKIYHEQAPDKLWKEQTFKEDKLIEEKCWDQQGKMIECK